MTENRLKYLINLSLEKKINSEQLKEMHSLLLQPENRACAERELEAAFATPKVEFDNVPDQKRRTILNAILKRGQKEEKIRSIKSVLKWVAAAACAGIVFTAGFYFLEQNSNQDKRAEYKNAVSLTDKNKKTPILILSNGKEIILTNAGIGNLATDAGVQISQNKNGQIIYEVLETAEATKNATNTITTPNGSRYKIALPDGSQVTLNTASSLTYFVSNGGKSRKVTLDGEAYFDIAKDKTRPFIVKTENQEVEVLGTHFNISSYSDDESEKTTLLEGSIRLSAFGVEKILKPGQQAKLNRTNISVDYADTSVAVAWKNNEFAFESESIEGLMRKVERWYNVETVFIGSKTDKKFSGMLSRFSDISQVLNIVESTNAAHFEIKGKKIFVYKSE